MTEQHIVWHQHAIDGDKRAQQKQQQACVLWFTGLSGSGKSTIAGALEHALVERQNHTYLLDGDNVRHGLCGDLSFSDADRVENIRRVGEVAKLMSDAGLIVLTAFISPFAKERDSVRQLLPSGKFIEVHIATSLSVCESRDPKGLYKKARAGEISHFTGIDSQYQAPEQAEVVINTQDFTVSENVQQLIDYLIQQGIIQ